MNDLAQRICWTLYQHRLLTTDQLHRLLAPERSRRWVQGVLATLERDGVLGERVRVAGEHVHAWHLSARGYAVTEGPDLERRPYRMTPDRARGPLQAHTLAVNETGVVLVEWARRLGHDFGPEGWRLETAHPLGPGRQDWLVADAVLDYTVLDVNLTTDLYCCRFLELDRATESPRRVMAKLAAYQRLREYPPGWRGYAIWPGVLVVMTGLQGPALERRVTALAGMAQRAGLDSAGLRIRLASLEALTAHGPMGAVWRPLEGGPAVDLVGGPARSAAS